MPTEIIVTPTTHWDREWVQTQIQYQIRLVQLIDHLMDILEADPAFTTFMLDGQTAPIEDYLQIKPHHRERLARLIQSGRILVGPWYVLADQFLQDGESTIRNLIIGRRQCRELGAEPMAVCYVPDSFGCIDSMPMFATGFGLRHAMFGRGRPANLQTDKKCFRWLGPDGSSILAANHGYGSGLFLSYPDIWTNIDRKLPNGPAALAAMKDMLPGLLGGEDAPVTYLSAGADHMEPRAGLRGVVEHLNKNIPDAVFRMDGPAAYFAAIDRAAPPLVNYAGELRGPDVKMFNGCTSSHMQLKQANFRSQRWLSAYLEPLATFALLCGHDYPHDFCDQLWRLLLINHPHDSICGCSIDRVHADMANRYARIEDAATMLTEQATRSIVTHISTGAPSADGGAVVVFNTLAASRGGLIQQWVRVPHRLAAEPLALIDMEGREQTGQVTVVAFKQMDLESLPMTTHQLGSVISKTAAPDRAADDLFTVVAIDAVVDTVPALGYRTFQLVPRTRIVEPVAASVHSTARGMSNGRIGITFNTNGTFNLRDERTGRTFKDLHHFEDTEDIGDAYGHRHYKDTYPITTRGTQTTLERIAELPHRITWRVTVPWRLPVSAEAHGDRSDASEDATIISEVTLHAGSDRVDIVTRFTNRCKDHRLRAVFDTPVDTWQSVAEGNFSLVNRAIPEPAASMEAYPQQSFVEVAETAGGLALYNKGLPEFEVLRAGRGTSLRLTLLRCTGELGPPAGANHPVPAAQCPGEYTFEYAVRPIAAKETATTRVAFAHDYTVPLCAEGADLHSGPLPAEGAFVKMEGAAIVTALKRAERSDDIVLRVWNPDNHEVSLQLTSPFGMGDASTTNLNEDHIAPCPTNGPEVLATVHSAGLTTIAFRPAHSI